MDNKKIQDKKNYKVIEHNLISSLPNSDKNYLLNLDKYIPNNDFFFEFDDTFLRFYFNVLDLELFKNKIYENLTNTYSLEVLEEIINQIVKIKSYGIKGRKRVYVDYNKERKVQGRKTKEETRGSIYYSQNNNFSKDINALPGEFLNKIIFGDSAEVLRKLPSNCIDLVFTSPPYNFGLDYNASKDGIDWNTYFDKLFEIFDECTRVLKYGGRLIVNVQPLFSDYIPIHHIISNHFMDNKLIWKGEIIWDKHNYNCKYTAWGSWKSPSSPYLKYTWEFIEIFCKGDLKKKGKTEDIDINEEEFKSWVNAKWDIAPERNMKNYDHPAMFPEKLVERVLKLFSYRNDIILDPFNGAGTTTLVAKRLGRQFLGIDISEEYCKTAEVRLKQLLSSFME